MSNNNIYTMKCISCNPPDDDKHRTIWSGEHGRLILRIDDQSAIGRCIWVFNKHLSDSKDLFFDEPHALKEKDLVKVVIAETLEELFGCVKIAELEIGNLTRDHEGNPTTNKKYTHLHYHFRPSYALPVQFDNKEFIDSNYSKPLNLEKKTSCDSETAKKIVEAIKPVFEAKMNHYKQKTQ